jgi:hypothetical protein
MRDAGFTSAFIDSKYSVVHGSQRLKDALTQLNELGMKGYIYGAEKWTNDKNDYADNPGFAGYFSDEPARDSHRPDDAAVTHLSDLVAPAQAFYEKYPDKLFHVNLFPRAANVSGNTPAEYDEYIQSYIDSVMSLAPSAGQKMICVDSYPLRYAASTNTADIATGWLLTIEAVAVAARDSGADFSSYIATMSIHGGQTRRPAEDDIRFQAYVNLAYGAVGISAFCYMSPGGPPYAGEFKQEDYAMIGEKGQRTEIYYDAQKVFLEIGNFGHVLRKFDWSGVIPVFGEDEEYYGANMNFINTRHSMEAHPRIASVKTEYDALIGAFADKNGNDGFMLVNFADPFYDTSNRVSIDFNGADYAVVYKGGERKIVSLKNGVYSVILAPGEGQFVIPFSG